MEKKKKMPFKQDTYDPYKAAIAVWGEEFQIRMCQEELAEAISVLNQYLRGRKTKDDVAEELADSEIVLQEMRRIFDPTTINNIKKQKLTRLRKRIEEAINNEVLS